MYFRLGNRTVRLPAVIASGQAYTILPLLGPNDVDIDIALTPPSTPPATWHSVTVSSPPDTNQVPGDALLEALHRADNGLKDGPQNALQAAARQRVADALSLAVAVQENGAITIASDGFELIVANTAELAALDGYIENAAITAPNGVAPQIACFSSTIATAYCVGFVAVIVAGTPELAAAGLTLFVIAAVVDTIMAYDDSYLPGIDPPPPTNPVLDELLGSVRNSVAQMAGLVHAIPGVFFDAMLRLLRQATLTICAPPAVADGRCGCVAPDSRCCPGGACGAWQRCWDSCCCLSPGETGCYLNGVPHAACSPGQVCTPEGNCFSP